MKTVQKKLSRFGEMIAKIPWGAESQPKEALQFRWDKDPAFRATYKIAKIGASGKEGRAKLTAIIGAKAAEALLNSEDRLMAWLAQDRSHPAAFALDPVGSIVRAGIKLDARTIARLRQHRAQLKRSVNSSLLDRLDSIKFEVSTDREED
jgi:hypothetical protein